MSLCTSGRKVPSTNQGFSELRRALEGSLRSWRGAYRTVTGQRSAMGPRSLYSGAQVTWKPGKAREPSQVGRTLQPAGGSLPPQSPPERGSHGAAQTGSHAPLTHVPFLHQGCAKSRSLNNIAGAAGTSLGLSPLASRYSSPYPPRKLLLSNHFHPLTSPPPGHSAP